jgi:LysR family transcriptional activator of nhaA
MDWLNYHHLLYFWTVAREGSIVRASEKLRLAQPTISGQIRKLEDSLEVELFERVGRGLVLTDAGRLVYRYAEEIFTLGQEVIDAARGRRPGRPLRFVVGVTDVLPKLVAYRLIAPALRIPEQVEIVCVEGTPERLLTELAIFGLDLVLSDAPISKQIRVRAYSHLLGQCGVSFFGTAKLTRKYQKDFPRSLDSAPMLLPSASAALRLSLERWFQSLKIRPIVCGEFDDSALLKVFGQAGTGLFCAPSVIEDEVKQQYRVKLLGRTDAVQERFYAMSVERKLKHPAVVAISEAAQADLFS